MAEEAPRRLQTVAWIDGHVRLIDQRQLPEHLVYWDIDNVDDIFNAIRTLAVRGAPAIGIAAAYGLYLGIRDFSENGPPDDFLSYVDKNARYLASARPTAVNLSWSLERLYLRACKEALTRKDISSIKLALLNEAHAIFNEDSITCRAIGENGFEIVKNCTSILTHCNAGGLAASEYGTALAPIYVALERGKVIRVYSDETRPLLQGSRLTAFELQSAGIPVTVICDSMAAVVMAQKKIDAVLVGADRIARNGDTANKIGTYGLAILAREHGIPFYVAAPLSTFDRNCSSGEKIPIEERDANEVTTVLGIRTAPTNVDVYNPAFDITPARLVTAIITERGILRPPFQESISSVLE